MNRGYHAALLSGRIMAIYRVAESELGKLRVRQWRRSALRTMGLLLAALTACAVGLTVLDSSNEPFAQGIYTGIWNAANLLTTLGDFTAFNTDQRLFMLFAMFVFISIGGYGMAKLTGLLSSEAVLIHRENIMVERNLEDLTDHIVVIGFGPLGKLVADRLAAAGHTVVIVEREAALTTDASGKGYIVVEGDAGADEGVLHHTNIARAHAMVLTIEEPDRKLAITLTAHSLNPSLQIVTTGSNTQRAELLKRAGASEVLIGDELIAGALVGRLVH
jgi:voltage-gated potassium channel